MTTFSSEIKAVRMKIDQTSIELRSQIAEQDSRQLQVQLGLARCATEIRAIIRAIFLSNVAIFCLILRYAGQATSLPATPGFVEDVVEGCLSIYTQLVTSWEMIMLILQGTKELVQAMKMTSDILIAMKEYKDTCN